MLDPALNISPLTIAAAVIPKARVKAGSSLGSARVYLDKTSYDRIDSIRGFVEKETGTRLSTSMVIRLALHLTAVRLKGAGETGKLAARVKASKEGR
jgi:hypothetical protein